MFKRLLAASLLIAIPGAIVFALSEWLSHFRGVSGELTSKVAHVGAGLVVFGDVPDTMVLLGAGIIIGQADSGVQWDHPELADGYRNDRTSPVAVVGATRGDQSPSGATRATTARTPAQPRTLTAPSRRPDSPARNRRIRARAGSDCPAV